jgi:hypothetical protein
MQSVCLNSSILAFFCFHPDIVVKKGADRRSASAYETGFTILHLQI